MAINTFWYYFGAFVGGIITSFLISFVSLMLYDVYTKWKLKRKIPKDEVTLKDPGKPMLINQKEVENDERTRLNKFREFEKLRRIDRIEGIKRAVESEGDDNRESERSSISYKPLNSSELGSLFPRTEHESDNVGDAEPKGNDKRKLYLD